MSVAVAAMLEGMPEAEDLRRWEADGQVLVTLGPQVLFCFDAADVGMRNLAVFTLRSLGFGGQRVAAVLGLSEEYVATLRQRGVREGSAGLVRATGRPSKLDAAALAKAAAWSAAGMSNVEIGRRLGVDDSTISRALTRHDAARAVPEPADQLDLPIADLPVVELPVPDGDGVAAAQVPSGEAVSQAAAVDVAGGDGDCGDAADTAAGRGAALVSAGIGQGVYTSRYAGSMLLHAFTDRIGAGAVLGRAAAGVVGQRRYDNMGLLSAVMMGFALGVGSVEASKHLPADQIGPLAGLARLPHLRTLRPRLHAIAAATDPLAMHHDLTAAMIERDAPLLGLYFVDEHFVPYEGAKPVGKGWNTKRRHAQKGRHDTFVVDYHARAVCFLSGEPAGLTKTITTVLTDLKQVTGPDAKIMLGFDRGGAYPQVFTACRDAQVDWLTYRRGKLAPTTTAPRRFWHAGTTTTPEAIWLADETIDVDGYGPCRQLTLFENNKPVLQVLTSDHSAPAAALLAWLRCRWRIENAFKYLTNHHGIDWLVDYTADPVDDTRVIDNPARAKAKTALTAAQTRLGDAEKAFTRLLADHTVSVADTNRAIPSARKNIDELREKVDQAKTHLATIPAKIAANQLTPGAKRAILHTRRRSLQMALRLLAYNSELWLAEHLNTYLADPDEYRAITRNLLHLGGTITYTPNTITVTLHKPPTPRITRALTLLLDEINTNPPHLPGDHRPITYHLDQP